MGALLSSISGQFTKSLVLGTFLPVVLFSLAFLYIMQPSLPMAIGTPALLSKLDPQWQLLLFTLLMIAAAGVLYHLNIAVIRLYEGYTWQNTWLGKWRTNVQLARWTELSAHRKRMQQIEGELTAAGQPPAWMPLADRMSAARSPLGWLLNETYPYSSATVLPTRLGNIIRNSEEYVSKRYGISAIPIWPRLIAKIDPGYAGQMDDAKVSLDFMLNCSFLSACCAVLGLWFTIAVVHGWDLNSLAAPLTRVLLFVVTCWLFYEGAIGRAAAWGAHIKSAFDLYRLPLLAQLGYEGKPKTLTEERDLWQALAVEYSFPDLERFPAKAQPYSPPIPPGPCFSVTTPNAAVTLTYSRGVTTPPPATAYPTVTVTIRVHNTSTVPAPSLVITDVVPANWDYLWGSAALSTGVPAAPDTSAPLTFTIGPLHAGATVTLSYQIQSLVR